MGESVAVEAAPVAEEAIVEEEKIEAAPETAEIATQTEEPEAEVDMTAILERYVSAATPVDPTEPVGPGAGKTTEYPNPEYFLYDKVSYFDLELEMKKDRCPQPSAK